MRRTLAMSLASTISLEFSKSNARGRSDLRSPEDAWMSQTHNTPGILQDRRGKTAASSHFSSDLYQGSQAKKNPQAGLLFSDGLLTDGDCVRKCAVRKIGRHSVRQYQKAPDYGRRVVARRSRHRTPSEIVAKGLANRTSEPRARCRLYRALFSSGQRLPPTTT